MMWDAMSYFNQKIEKGLWIQGDPLFVSLVVAV